ncbi:unnamed protein product [Microthlaspi erraticum]|uniref:Uncharacterized protein n=1 Tax=Microthlaspi erraticum TaxID=1685480 RepID=A0A6D2IXS0_9BRAS|nr:unnamed protein product [Microthlaspi erraticum]
MSSPKKKRKKTTNLSLKSSPFLPPTPQSTVNLKFATSGLFASELLRTSLETALSDSLPPVAATTSDPPILVLGSLRLRLWFLRPARLHYPSPSSSWCPLPFVTSVAGSLSLSPAICSPPSPPPPTFSSPLPTTTTVSPSHIAGIRPDVATYNSLIAGVARRLMLDPVFYLFDEMLEWSRNMKR